MQKPGIRVNAIAPGLSSSSTTGQNFNEDGTPTARSHKILNHTPMGRFGEAEELIGTLYWLVGSKCLQVLLQV